MLTLSLGLALTLPGCVTRAHIVIPTKAENNVDRLIAHPEFKQAAQVSPHFVADALNTIARLEKEKADAGK